MLDEIVAVRTAEDDRGRWVAVVSGIGLDGTLRESQYRTSPAKTGLWKYARGEWKQILGTAQFAARSRRDFRDKLRGLVGEYPAVVRGGRI